MEIESEDISEDLLGSLSADEGGDSQRSDKPDEERLYPIELDEENINKRSLCCKWAYTDFNITRIRFADDEVKYLIEGNEVAPTTGSKRGLPLASL